MPRLVVSHQLHDERMCILGVRVERPGFAARTRLGRHSGGKPQRGIGAREREGTLAPLGAFQSCRDDARTLDFHLQRQRQVDALQPRRSREFDRDVVAGARRLASLQTRVCNERAQIPQEDPVAHG